jgi:ATP synthase protein I
MTGEAGGQRRDTRTAAPSMGEYAGVGLQFALTIVAFMFAGIWLDRRLGTSPWLVIIFVFGGAAAGFYSIYRKLIAAQRRADDARRAERAERGER